MEFWLVPPLHREFQPPGTEGGCLGCDLVGTLMGMALVWDGWREGNGAQRGLRWTVSPPEKAEKVHCPIMLRSKWVVLLATENLWCQ